MSSLAAIALATLSSHQTRLKRIRQVRNTASCSGAIGCHCPTYRSRSVREAHSPLDHCSKTRPSSHTGWDTRWRSARQHSSTLISQLLNDRLSQISRPQRVKGTENLAVFWR